MKAKLLLTALTLSVALTACGDNRRQRKSVPSDSNSGNNEQHIRQQRIRK